MMDLGHELFEDFLLYGPEAQYVLAMRFCAATALITAVGWDPTKSTPMSSSSRCR
jgi:predicted nucleic acid-binding Zn finger protein